MAKVLLSINDTLLKRVDRATKKAGLTRSDYLRNALATATPKRKYKTRKAAK